MQYYIWVLGCAMNKSDAERIASVFQGADFTETKKESEADIIVTVACSVRQTAIDRIYGKAKNWQRIKKERPLITILSGCVLKRDKKKMAKMFDFVFEIKEIKKLSDFLSSIIPHSSPVIPASSSVIPASHSIIPHSSPVIPASSSVIPAQAGIQSSQNIDSRLRGNDNNNFEKTISGFFQIHPKYESSFQAYVPVSTGCDNFCTYCAVPYTRGREISRPMEDILTEVKELVKKGYKEITILGQNVNSYGFTQKNQKTHALFQSTGQAEEQKSAFNTEYKTLNTDSVITSPSSVIPASLPVIPATHSVIPASLPVIPAQAGIQKKTDSGQARMTSYFVELLKQIDEIPGDYRVFFYSNHPKDMSDELIETLPKLQHFPRYIHLPIQSGSDRIIKAMNRHYTQEKYLKLVEKIKKAMPDVALTTDIIVGFPGETEKDFEETKKVMKKVGFSMSFIARYSPRPGTVAAKVADSVSQEEKEKRWQTLTNIQEQILEKENKKLVGKHLRVLIDSEKKGKYYGRTDSYKVVEISSSVISTDSPMAIGAIAEKSLSPKKQTSPKGRFVDVEIIDSKAWMLKGRIIP